MTVALVGENWYGLKARLDELTQAFIKEHGDLVLEKIDGQETSLAQIVGSIESVPFLASKKMVILRNLSANKEASEALEALIEKAGETTDLIVVESKLDKRSVYYKYLKKLPNFEEFNELDGRGVANWLVAEAKKYGGKISASDAQYLAERAGNNQSMLGHELEKLIAYQPEISRRSIDLLVEETSSSTIFNLLDSAFSGNLKDALDLYQQQRSQRIEPQAIHAMLVWQMHMVAMVSSAGADANANKIAQDSGMNPFVIQKSQRIAQKMGRAKVLQFMKLLRDMDYKSKREALDYDEALRFAIISLAS